MTHSARQRRRARQGPFLPFHRPSIGDDEIEAVVETLRSGWITTGPGVLRFEEAFARYVGSAHAVAVNSGTAALHLALAAVGVAPGDEVIVPTMTFTATAEAVLYFGARPVLVDCRRDTFNIDEGAMEERIGPRTRAVIPVHMAGQPCAMGPILELARARGLKVVEDAAHTPPAAYEGRAIGAIGDITAFSFYATKTITTGEGGMATTDDAKYAERMRTLRLHGISNDGWRRHDADASWYYEVVETGYKYNMTDLAAALGEAQLKRAEDLYERRSRIAARYTEAFDSIDAVRPPAVAPNVQHAWHLYIVILDPEALTIDRGRFIEELKARNIGTSVHFIPLHLHPYYQSALGYRPGDFPVAEWVYERCVSLPIYPDMRDEDMEDVIDAVRDVTETFKR